MEARLVSISLILFIYLSLGANYATRNFIVTAADPAFARQIAEQAENYRKELAELWLGHELPAWPQRCPIKVRIEMHAGGETSFAFVPDQTGTSQPIDWRMEIFGPPERLLDSVLPHEVTHTIFATHFGRPLPRWADEGACTTVEHNSEKRKNHKMLMEFLSTNRGIPFNHMFAMKQYPRDILPLYSQGYSLARYLIEQRGHRHFVDFVGEGMAQEIPGREPQIWNRVAKKYYGYDDLSDLQIKWLGWVKKGSPKLQLVSNPTPETLSDKALVANAQINPVQNRSRTAAPIVSNQPVSSEESWYIRQSRSGGNATMHKPQHPLNRNAAAPNAGTVWR